MKVLDRTEATILKIHTKKYSDITHSLSNWHYDSWSKDIV